MTRDFLQPLKHLARRWLPMPVLTTVRRVWQMAGHLDPRWLRRRRDFRLLNVTAEEGELVLRDELRVSIDPRSREAFEWYCYSSLEAVAELDAFLAWMTGRSRLLDVGASHGLFSLVFTLGREHAKAMAIEPSSPAFEVLQENLKRNSRCDVISVPMAAGASSGEISMRQVWYHLEALPSSGIESDALVIPIRPLDELCEEHSFIPDLVKIDVEGYELAVLKGSQRLLKTQRPPIFLEVHPSHLAAQGDSPGDLFSFMTSCGYCPFTLGRAPLDPARLSRLDRVFHVLCLASRGGPWPS